VNKLTEVAIRNARPREKPYPLTDGAGLYLLVNPNGSKWWRFRFRFGRKDVVVAGKNTEKEQLLSCGVYPEVSLREARHKRDEFRALLRKGINPKAQERAAKLAAANTFRLVALEWIQNLEHPPKDSKLRPLSPKTLRRHKYLLNTYLFPELGPRPMSEITVPELFSVLKHIQDKGIYETRKKASQLCGKLWRYATVTGRASNDITPNLRGNFLNPKSEPYAAITEPEGIGQLLRAIDGYTGHRLTVIALKLSPLLFTRPVELRIAKWPEFDLARGMWRIPPERIKKREPQYVPLSRQAIALLREAHAITGHYEHEHVFANPSRPDRPMSNNTLNGALHALGYKDEQTNHGFRSTASTRLNSMGFPPDIIELQLSHQEENESRRPYNHAARMPERRQMMQIWADVLDQWRLGNFEEEFESVTFQPVFRPIAARTKKDFMAPEEQDELAEAD
jgi:integrase